MSFKPPYLDEKVLETMDTTLDPRDDITQILSQDAYSVRINVAGVHRADGARLASNSPCEDRFNRVQLLSLPNHETWIASAVFDGHNGWQTAEYLERELLVYVKRSLEEHQPQLQARDATIQLAIKKAFVRLDRSIIDTYINSVHSKDIKLDEKMRYMQIAMSGSCALLSLYDPTASNLYTACTGDSRAVLGQQNFDGTWTSVALSEDQKGDNNDEVVRLQLEHPGEADVVKNGKVLGLAVSRAFGDIPWKLPHDIQLDLGKRFFSNGPMEKSTIPTPLYLTAEPVVTVTHIKQPSFLVLATDGLWDECSNREVVDLVVRWLEAQPGAAEVMKMTPMCVWWKSQTQEPADYAPGFDFLQRWEGFDTRFREERTAIKDLDNVAVHLLRNACGGNHEELLAGKLAAQPPYSRVLRDDMTVQVVFFNMSK